MGTEKVWGCGYELEDLCEIDEGRGYDVLAIY